MDYSRRFPVRPSHAVGCMVENVQKDEEITQSPNMKGKLSLPMRRLRVYSSASRRSDGTHHCVSLGCSQGASAAEKPRATACEWNEEFGRDLSRPEAKLPSTSEYTLLKS
jgi:hypothetical protein